jgi:general secretion pathway protein K
VDYEFPSGVSHVEFLPEASKLNVNTVPVQDLNKLILALGIEPGRAQEITEAIDDWRRVPDGGTSRFDGHYLSLTPSFQSPHASLQEIEELLLVQGVTPDIFYGTYVPSEDYTSGNPARGGAPGAARRADRVPVRSTAPKTRWMPIPLDRRF